MSGGLRLGAVEMFDTISQSALYGPVLAFSILGVFLVAGALVHWVLGKVINRKSDRLIESLMTTVLSDVRGPLVIFVFLIGVVLCLVTLAELENTAYDFLNRAGSWARLGLVVAAILQGALIATRLSQDLLAWYLRKTAATGAGRAEAALLPPIKRIMPIVIYSIAGLMVLDSFGIAISPLLAGIGIGGIAVALAIQPTLTNFLAGTFLVAEGEFKPGHYVEVQGGPSGYVIDVGWRSTKIRSRFNNTVLIPNSVMVESIVTNYHSPNPALNVIVNCGISYDSDLDVVERLVMEEAKAIRANSEYAVTTTEPFFAFQTFGDSNIDFFVMVQATDRLGGFVLESQLIKAIHSRFKREGIEINYPVRKLVNGIEPPTDLIPESPSTG